MDDYKVIYDYDLGRVPFYDGIPYTCKRCGWKESGRCYNEKFAIVTKCVGMNDPDYIAWAEPQIAAEETKGDRLVKYLDLACFNQRGQLITFDLFKKCQMYRRAEAYLKQVQEVKEEFKKPEPIPEPIEEDKTPCCSVCGDELDDDEDGVCWWCYDKTNTVVSNNFVHE